MFAQELIVFGIVLAAAAYLARVVFTSLTGEKSCGSCGSGKKCGSKSPQTGPSPHPSVGSQLIQIGLSGSSSTGSSSKDFGKGNREQPKPR